MPLKTWDTKADWDFDYRRGTGYRGPSGDEVKVHYVKRRRQGIIDRLVGYYGNLLGPAAYNKRFVIVGGGFGWIAQGLLSLGFLNVVVAETSAYILAEMNNTDEAELRGNITAAGIDPDSPTGQEILGKHATPGPRRGTVEVIDADVLTSDGRNTIKSAVGGNPQIVVTEDIMPSLYDAECLALSEACREFGGQQQVVHAVTAVIPGRGTSNPGFNWKTLVEWKALIPDDIWIDVRSGEVLD